MQIQTQQIEIPKLTNPNFSILMDIWTGLCDGRLAPAWRDVKLPTFPGKIIPFITVVDIVESPDQFSYRFWGTGHSRVKGIDLTGKSPQLLTPKAVADLVCEEFTQVRDNKIPMAFVHDIRPQPDEPSKIQETLRLPLSCDGQTVTNILSLADWQTDQTYWSNMYARLKTDSAAATL